MRGTWSGESDWTWHMSLRHFSVACSSPSLTANTTLLLLILPGIWKNLTWYRDPVLCPFDPTSPSLHKISTATPFPLPGKGAPTITGNVMRCEWQKRMLISFNPAMIFGLFVVSTQNNQHSEANICTCSRMGFRLHSHRFPRVQKDCCRWVLVALVHKKCSVLWDFVLWDNHHDMGHETYLWTSGLLRDKSVFVEQLSDPVQLTCYGTSGLYSKQQVLVPLQVTFPTPTPPVPHYS